MVSIPCPTADPAIRTYTRRTYTPRTRTNTTRPKRTEIPKSSTLALTLHPSHPIPINPVIPIPMRPTQTLTIDLRTGVHTLWYAERDELRDVGDVVEVFYCCWDEVCG